VQGAYAPDRLVLSELHQGEAEALRDHMSRFAAKWNANKGSTCVESGDGNSTIHPVDGVRHKAEEVVKENGGRVGDGPHARGSRGEVPRWRVIQNDGFDTWISHVPPPERRGLVRWRE